MFALPNNKIKPLPYQKEAPINPAMSNPLAYWHSFLANHTNILTSGTMISKHLRPFLWQFFQYPSKGATVLRSFAVKKKQEHIHKQPTNNNTYNITLRSIDETRLSRISFALYPFAWGASPLPALSSPAAPLAHHVTFLDDCHPACMAQPKSQPSLGVSLEEFSITYRTKKHIYIYKALSKSVTSFL